MPAPRTEPVEPLPLPTPPPVRPLGLVGTIRQLQRNSIGIYAEAAYGTPFSTMRLGWQDFVLINEPDFIQHVLVANHANYGKGRINRQILGPALGQGLLTAEGETWRRHRRIAAPAFLPRRLVPVADIVVGETLNLIRNFSHAPQPFDLNKAMMELTMNVVARALFGRDIAGAVDRVGSAIGTLIESLGQVQLIDLIGLPEWLPRRRGAAVREALRVVEATIEDILRERRRPGAPARDDLLALLLAARDEETGAGFDDRQLRDEILTLFAAGHETTAVALCWTWLLLDRHPSVRARLEAELDAVLGGRPPGYDDLERLPYTRMVFEEAMRLYPPAFTINRVALAEDRVGPHRIPAGAIVSISPWVTHRNPRLWPEPGRFDPERFHPEAARARHRYAYLPFGGGPRVCIGNGFAMLEGRLVLATVAQACRLRLAPGQRIEPLARITLRPSPGIRASLEPRPAAALLGAAGE